jgi:hypothetical protein
LQFPRMFNAYYTLRLNNICMQMTTRGPQVAPRTSQCKPKDNFTKLKTKNINIYQRSDIEKVVAKEITQDFSLGLFHSLSYSSRSKMRKLKDFTSPRYVYISSYNLQVNKLKQAKSVPPLTPLAPLIKH